MAKPPHVESEQWDKLGNVERLNFLNEWRRPQHLRTAKTWDQMKVFLKEEHIPESFPPDYHFPMVWTHRVRDPSGYAMEWALRVCAPGLPASAAPDDAAPTAAAMVFPGGGT